MFAVAAANDRGADGTVAALAVVVAFRVPDAAEVPLALVAETLML